MSDTPHTHEPGLTGSESVTVERFFQERLRRAVTIPRYLTRDEQCFDLRFDVAPDLYVIGRVDLCSNTVDVHKAFRQGRNVETNEPDDFEWRRDSVLNPDATRATAAALQGAGPY